MTISIEGLSKRYGGRYAVREASFEVHPGMVTGFLGPNGAGKSTTLRSIVGLDRPTAGRALINGTPYRKLRAPLLEVGTLLDGGSAHKARTAANHLRWIAATHGIGRRRVNEVMELTGLGSVARRRVGGFSLGMTQRLGIAAALLGDPHTLILDEPVNGLDPDGVTWLRELLVGFAASGGTVFLSSHLLGELSLIAQHIVVIGRGRIIADKPLSELVSPRSIVHVRTPSLPELTLLLAGEGVTVANVAAGTAELEGISAEAVAERAASAGIVLYELRYATTQLEDAYNLLTRDVVEYGTPDRPGRTEA